jgi:metal-responsive CopG/Arc/MetJ family transcriptional regulator
MNMGRTTKILGFSVPPAVVREVETLAKAERRTKSELFREMVRVYRRFRLQRDRDEERWINSIIAQARAEEAADPMGDKELLAEDLRLAKYGQQQAKKLGIKTDMRSINRIVHERRKARRS